MTKCGSKDEFSRIRSIDAIVGRPSSRVTLGIGDDAAIVLPTKDQMLLSTDAMVEGVHFDLSYVTPADLGHKALASALSDLAAMNGHALYALLSIALPKHAPDDFLESFYASAQTLAKQFEVDIVGGDLTSSKGGIFIDVACIGESSHPIRRSGARIGDWVAVSGTPGAAAAGLKALQKFSRDRVPASLVKAFLRPMPRFDLLPDLQSSVTSMIDISDGLSSELHHLAKASGVGFEIDSSRIPVNEEAIELAEKIACKEPLEWTLSGGEDYELLVTLDPTKVQSSGSVPKGFTVIGRATCAEAGVILLDSIGGKHEIKPTGFNHFASS